jgi:hypothetical protein
MARDDFSEGTKSALAHRAAYFCSFAGCLRPTVGPSDEASDKVANIGIAAHICAASPGGARYDAAMSSSERKNIDNGIWLCSDHASLIDRDTTQFTVKSLKEMKTAHEEWCSRRLHSRNAEDDCDDDLIAVGPQIIGSGRLDRVDSSKWEVTITHFLMGNIGSLISYIEQFERAPSADRYVLVNAIGDGRTVVGPPSFERLAAGYRISCQIARAFPRIRADKLGTDIKISAKGDIELTPGGDLAVVSGLAALPQTIGMALSMRRGDYRLYPDHGTRFAEFYRAFKASPWLGRLLKLDVVRLAAIPYADAIAKSEYLPLHCVDSVRDVTVLDESAKELRIRIDLDVFGLGPWNCEVHVSLEPPPEPKASYPR